MGVQKPLYQFFTRSSNGNRWRMLNRYRIFNNSTSSRRYSLLFHFPATQHQREIHRLARARSAENFVGKRPLCCHEMVSARCPARGKFEMLVKLARAGLRYLHVREG